MRESGINTGKKKAVVMTRFPYESSWGGEESHTLTLAKHLRSKGYEVVFMGSCPVLLKKFTELSFPVKKVWGGKMVVTPFELLKSFFLFPFIKLNITRHFRKLVTNYDVRALYCLSLNEKVLLTQEAIRLKIPTTWVEHQEVRGWLLRSPWRNLYQSLSPFVKIVPICKVNMQRLADIKIEAGNMVEIVNGVDLEMASQNIRKTQKNLLVVANRFISKKGIMDFLSTLPNLFTEYPDLEVKIIGEGPERELMESFIKNKISGMNISIINFLKKENWFELLSRCDVYVSTARDSNETFSLSTAEALANGCKVVVTTCSGISDFLTNGEDAFLTEPMNPEKLEMNIKRALMSSEELRENAKTTAKKMFDQNKMLLQYESVILRV
jgi:glycosyltransferase involved in cell wall biosynthesis